LNFNNVKKLIKKQVVKIMSKCFNPDCLNQNPADNNFCQKCGQKLLLKDHFRGLKYLGQGGFGRAFVGIDEHRRNSYCVIKQFLPLQQGSGALNKCIQLFEQEAELLEKLGKHPQIPDLLAFFEQDGKLYLIQEFVEGENLLTELQKRRDLTLLNPYSENEVKTFLIEMLPVLDFIHHKNIIHRDIKPENILRRKTPVDPSIYGQISDLVLIDFGVSKQVSNSIMTQMGTTVGTPAYSAPEQTRGIVNPSSDLYSLAVTAIRLLTGVLPEERNGSLVDEIFNINDFTWIWKEWLSKNGLSVSNDLANILDKMLADTISDRFQSAREVLDALNTPLSTSQIQSPVINIPTQTTPTVIQPTTNNAIKLQTNLADFSKLEQLLAQEKWKEADQETGLLILKIFGTKYLFSSDMKNCQNFQLEKLKIIDNLWVKYSKGQFGFSVQKQIWLDCGGILNLDDDFEILEQNALILDKFGDHIGWRKKEWFWRKGINYSELTFDLNAPRGHLPCCAEEQEFYVALCTQQSFAICSRL
jgi:serine/threonine protein kinase